MTIPIEDAVTVSYVSVVHAISELENIVWLYTPKPVRDEVEEALEDLRCALTALQPHATNRPDWRVVRGTYRYEVSNEGEVRSRDKNGRARTLKQSPDRDGYPSVSLYVDGKSKTTKVATIVALAFLGDRPEGMHVCHNDGDRTNSRLENLRYGTPQSNEADKYLHGTKLTGANHPNAKLSGSDVKAIRQMLADGETQREIAAKYGVTHRTIGDIKRGKKYVGVGIE